MAVSMSFAGVGCRLHGSVQLSSIKSTSSEAYTNKGFRLASCTTSKRTLKTSCLRAAVNSTSQQVSVRAETSFFDAEEAAKAIAEGGYTVLDVRDQSQYDRARIQGSVHVPAYVENTDNDIGTIIKRQAHNNFAGFLYGLAFTKINDQFVSTVANKFPKDSKLLLVCQEGLRSGSALSKLEGAGFENLALLTAGLNKVPTGIFPKEGDRELKDAGKGGFVSIQTQFSAVLAFLLISAYLALEFFPEQSSAVLKAIYSLGG